MTEILEAFRHFSTISLKQYLYYLRHVRKSYYFHIHDYKAAQINSGNFCHLPLTFEMTFFRRFKLILGYYHLHVS